MPWVPEALLRLRRWWAVRRALRRSSRPGTFSAADLVLYQAAWARPGAMSSMVNWYRAAARFARRLGATGRVRVPLCIIWGRDDAFLNANLAQESLAFCDDGRLTYLPVTHWVQHEATAKVNELLIEFLQEPSL